MMQGLYRHYKGALYFVLYTGTHTETMEKLVIYVSAKDASKVWVRPYSMFIENVEVDGQQIPRFIKIEE